MMEENSSLTDFVLSSNSVPHITDAIQDWIEKVARIPVDDSGQEPDVCIGKFETTS